MLHTLSLGCSVRGGIGDRVFRKKKKKKKSSDQLINYHIDDMIIK